MGSRVLEEHLPSSSNTILMQCHNKKTVSCLSPLHVSMPSRGNIDDDDDAI
jgi:hypothetical protein